MEKKHYKLKNYVIELLFVCANVLSLALFGYLQGLSMDMQVRNIVLGILMYCILGALFRSQVMTESLCYDNGEKILRAMGVLSLASVCSQVLSFLPHTGWPFPVIFVFVSLYTNPLMGGFAGSIYLLCCVLLCQEGIMVFSIYFVSGIFCVILFSQITENFKMVTPLVISMICLLVCEMVPIVLLNESFLEVELYVIPICNLVVCTVLLIFVLKSFYQYVIFKDRMRYVDLQNPEAEILKAYKEKDKHAYYVSIHSAYFCERIADKLGLNSMALKVCALYHDFKEDKPDMPAPAEEILQEYRKEIKPIQKKETAVLFVSIAVIEAVYEVMGKEVKPDYDRLIDAVFHKWFGTSLLHYSNITLLEIETMRKIFKEEKLYYDFLR